MRGYHCKGEFFFFLIIVFKYFSWIDTFKALDGPMKKEVEGAVASFLTKGQKSLITYKVDQSIVGGMIVSIGDKYVDMSIASKLKKYSDMIKTAA